MKNKLFIFMSSLIFLLGSADVFAGSSRKVSYSGNGLSILKDLVTLRCSNSFDINIEIGSELFTGKVKTNRCSSRRDYSLFTIESLDGRSICTGEVAFYKRHPREGSRVAIAEFSFDDYRRNHRCPLAGRFIERTTYRSWEPGQDYYAALVSNLSPNPGTEVFADPHRACEAPAVFNYTTVESGIRYSGKMTFNRGNCRGYLDVSGFFVDTAEDGSSRGCKGEIRIVETNDQDVFQLEFIPRGPAKNGYVCNGIGNVYKVRTHLVRD
jgi:hypothetical protein